MNLKWIICTSVVALSLVFANHAQAQSAQLHARSLALKSGETVELRDFYAVTNCNSILVGMPEITVMEGPPGVTASAVEAMVVPRYFGCPKPVKGAKLRLSADKIEDYSQSQAMLRVKYKTKDGDREFSIPVNLTLFP